MIRPLAPVSCGVADRITILEIKSRRLESPDPRTNVARELEQLLAITASITEFDERIAETWADLGRVNEALWEIEDRLRAHERAGDFGPAFVNLGNTASLRGGAIFNEGASPTLNNVTISGNTAPADSGGAIRSITFASITSNIIVENSILWGNGSEEIASDVTDNITLVDSVIQGGCPTGAVCTNIISTDPVLAGLANNGGFTQTRALRNGSSAINAGGANSTCASDDQRGAERPQGDGCDIGAFEAYLLTVTADSKPITFGDAEPLFGFQYDGLLHGNDTGAVIDTPPACGVSGTHTNAGTYNDSWTFTGAANYHDIAATAIINTIAKANATVVVTPYSVTYDGLAHTETYTITGVNGESGATVGTWT